MGPLAVRSACLLALGLVAAPAAAQDGGAPDAGAPALACPPDTRGCHAEHVDFSYRETLLDPIDLDSGWVPDGAAVQVRFQLHVGGEASVALGGTVAASWPAPMSIHVPGRAGTGRLAMDYGMELTVRLRFDVDVAGIRYRWEGDVPVPFFPEDLRMAASATFDPFVLPGATPRPILIRDATDRFVAFRYDVTSFIVDIPGIAGGFALDLMGTLESSYQTERIAVSRGAPIVADGTATVIGPDGALPGFGASEDVTVRPEGTLAQDAVITLYPNLFFSIARHPFRLDLAEVPLRIVDRRVDVAFPEATVHVPLPDLRVTPMALDLGEVPVGRTEERFLVVANDGEAPLEVIAEMASAPFETPAPSIVVPPRAEGRLAVRYLPAAAGAASDVLFLSSNDPDAPLVSVLLSGRGLAPPPAVTDAGVPGTDAGAPPAPAVADDGGCGCRVAGHARDGLGSLAAVAAVAVALTRARRRSRRSGAGPRG